MTDTPNPLLIVPNSQKRNTRELPGSPKPPRPKPIRVAKDLPAPDLTLPPWPTLAANDATRLQSQSDDLARVRAASGFLAHAVSRVAPLDHIERQLGVRAGSLGEIIADDRK